MMYIPHVQVWSGKGGVDLLTLKCLGETWLANNILVSIHVDPNIVFN